MHNEAQGMPTFFITIVHVDVENHTKRRKGKRRKTANKKATTSAQLMQRMHIVQPLPDPHPKVLDTFGDVPPRPWASNLHRIPMESTNLLWQ